MVNFRRPKKGGEPADQPPSLSPESPSGIAPAGSKRGLIFGKHKGSNSGTVDEESSGAGVFSKSDSLERAILDAETYLEQEAEGHDYEATPPPSGSDEDRESPVPSGSDVSELTNEHLPGSVTVRSKHVMSLPSSLSSRLGSAKSSKNRTLSPDPPESDSRRANADPPGRVADLAESYRQSDGSATPQSTSRPEDTGSAASNATSRAVPTKPSTTNTEKEEAMASLRTGISTTTLQKNQSPEGKPPLASPAKKSTPKASNSPSNLVQNLLNMMDMTCVAPAAPRETASSSTLSFSPEWGIAPSRDDDTVSKSAGGTPRKFSTGAVEKLSTVVMPVCDPIDESPELATKKSLPAPTTPPPTTKPESTATPAAGAAVEMSQSVETAELVAANEKSEQEAAAAAETVARDTVATEAAAAVAEAAKHQPIAGDRADTPTLTPHNTLPPPPSSSLQTKMNPKRQQMQSPRRRAPSPVRDDSQKEASPRQKMDEPGGTQPTHENFEMILEEADSVSTGASTAASTNKENSSQRSDASGTTVSSTSTSSKSSRKRMSKLFKKVKKSLSTSGPPKEATSVKKSSSSKKLSASGNNSNRIDKKETATKTSAAGTQRQAAALRAPTPPPQLLLESPAPTTNSSSSALKENSRGGDRDPPPPETECDDEKETDKTKDGTRYKSLVGSFRNLSTKEPLPTVDEELSDDSSSDPVDKVRVPGLALAPDKFLTHKDLLGDECCSLEEEKMEEHIAWTNSAMTTSSKETSVSSRGTAASVSQAASSRKSTVSSETASSDSASGEVSYTTNDAVEDFECKTDEETKQSDKRGAISSASSNLTDMMTLSTSASKDTSAASSVATGSNLSGIRRSRTWMEKLGLSSSHNSSSGSSSSTTGSSSRRRPSAGASSTTTGSGSSSSTTTETTSSSVRNRRSHPVQLVTTAGGSQISSTSTISATLATQSTSTFTNSTSFRAAKKAQWRACVDPASGRTYYYHRQTRETTWIRPKDTVVLPPRTDVVTETKAETPVVEEEEELVKEGTELELQESDDTKKVNFPVVVVDSQSGNYEYLKNKREILDILKTMDPPEELSVEKLLAQYEGKEEELLEQLRDMKERQPFDEPLLQEEEKTTTPATPPRTTSVKSWASTPKATGANNGVSPPRDYNTYDFELDPLADPGTPPVSMKGRSRSVNSGLVSESTMPIRNTSYQVNDSRNRSLAERSQDTSLSSKPEDEDSDPDTTSKRHAPSNIPVPRTRELMVEEFSSDRHKAESFERRGMVRTNMKPYHTRPPVRRSRSAQANSQQETAAKYEHGPDEHAYRDAVDGNDDLVSRDMLMDAGSTQPGDSISALSEPDTGLFGFFGGFMSSDSNPVSPMHPYDNVRRRALDDAIAREDWDLAAALSEGMRTAMHQRGQLLHHHHPHHHAHHQDHHSLSSMNDEEDQYDDHHHARRGRGHHSHGEWRQSELDRFISENDWDAVAGYIARVRDANNGHRIAQTRSFSPPRHHSTLTTPKNGSSRRTTSSSSSSSSGTSSSDHHNQSSNPKRRFGARSQLQHSDLYSDDSWESGSYDSTYDDSDDYTSESSFTEDEPIVRRTQSARRRNFAC